MKSKLFPALALIGLSSLSYGALYTVQTGTGANINGFANSAGQAFQNNSTTGFPTGVGAFGFFTVADDQLPLFTSASDLLTAFTVFGGPASFAVSGPFGQRGAIEIAGVNTVTGTEFAGRNMYFVVGNAAALPDMTEVAILKTTFTFNPADDALPTPTTLTLRPASADVMYGRVIEDLRTTNTDSVLNPGWATVAFIPEPSVALLGAFGLLGLLRRRR